MKKRLSVIVISWNEIDTLCKCLSTLVPTIDFEKDEIILVDNGSKDNTVEKVKKLYPKINVIGLKKNIGVVPARNVGIKNATGTYIMTLDNDTRVLSTKIIGEVVEKIFKSTPNLGLLGFRLLNPDGTIQSSTRRYPNILQPFAARIPFLLKFKIFKHIQSNHLMEDVDSEDKNELTIVDYVLGANQIYRRKDADRLGGYDENIFYGPEDCDFCLRIKDLGLNTALCSEVKIEHDYNRRTQKFSMITIKHIMGFYYLFLKRRELWYLQ